jgi:hypothetical protein
MSFKVSLTKVNTNAKLQYTNINLKKLSSAKLFAGGLISSKKVNFEKYTTAIDHAVSTAITIFPIKKFFLKLVE